jgi:hypothetical protein
LEGSPDLAAARDVAAHIGSIHHEVNFTVQEGLDAIRDVIYHLETYDVTTVRASTPMYLLARVIKSMGIKMVLSGEVRMNCLADTCISTRHPMQRHSTKKRYANSANSICMTAYVPINHLQRGVSKAGYHFSTRNLWMWPCVSILQTKWRAMAK